MAYQSNGRKLSPLARYIKAAKDSSYANNTKASNVTAESLQALKHPSAARRAQAATDLLEAALARFDTLPAEEQSALGYALAGYAGDNLWNQFVPRLARLSAETLTVLLVSALRAGTTARARRLIGAGATLQPLSQLPDPWTALGLNAHNEHALLALAQENLLTTRDKASLFLRAALRNREQLALGLWQTGVDQAAAVPLDLWDDANTTIATIEDLIDLDHSFSPEQARIIAAVDLPLLRRRVASKDRLTYRTDTLEVLVPLLHPDDVRDIVFLVRQLVIADQFDSLNIIKSWPACLTVEDFDAFIDTANGATSVADGAIGDTTGGAGSSSSSGNPGNSGIPGNTNPAMVAYLLDWKNQCFGPTVQDFDLRL